MKRNNIIIDNRTSINTWARTLHLLTQQTEIIAGDEFLGNDNMTKDACIFLDLDEEAVEEILLGNVHPKFQMGSKARMKYALEFTYRFVKDNWNADKTKKFDYNYMDRFINYPMLNQFYYQGELIDDSIPIKYKTKHSNCTQNDFYTGGIDQIKIIHDKLREEGISRRHQIITWIPTIDLFTKEDPCLQRLWIRCLVPKSQWYKYPECIPLEVHIMYRSWDIPGALPANLYALLNCINRYICGNLTEENELLHKDTLQYLNIKDKFEDAIFNSNIQQEFKIVNVKCIGNAGHGYYSYYDLMNKVKQI